MFPQTPVNASIMDSLWLNYLLIFDFHSTDLNLLGQINIIELMFEERARILSKQSRP